MKNIFKIGKSFLTNLLLVGIAYIILRYLLIPSVIITAFLSFFRTKVGNAFTNFSDYFLEVAVAIDQLGNVICADLFNLTLIKKEGYKFGNPDETISSVLGKNKLNKTLTKVGKIIDWVLEMLDDNHSIKSIETFNE